MRAVELFVVLLAACGSAGCPAGWDDAPPPPPGQPCTELEVACPTQHGCCPSNSTCGGEPASVGCLPASCCPIGGVFAGAREADGGAPRGVRPMRRQ